MSAFIDLTGKDPFSQHMPRANSVLESTVGDIAPMAGSGVLDWINIGSSLLGGMLSGGSDSSQASGISEVALNTSGWVVGKGDADGGTLETTRGLSMPWYVWLLGTVVVISIIKAAK